MSCLSVITYFPSCKTIWEELSISVLGLCIHMSDLVTHKPLILVCYKLGIYKYIYTDCLEPIRTRLYPNPSLWRLSSERKGGRKHYNMEDEEKGKPFGIK